MSIEKIDNSKNCVEEFEDAYHSVVKYLEQVSKLFNQAILWLIHNNHLNRKNNQLSSIHTLQPVFKTATLFSNSFVYDQVFLQHFFPQLLQFQ